jgi:hypothetical protein
MMESLLALHDALPWYLQWNGSGRLYEILTEWGAQQGIIRGDNWTLIFLWLYKWLAVGALLWGVGAALLVTKRSERGRFRGDPEKYRDAAVTGALRAVTGAAIAAGIVLVLFVATLVGPGPIFWIGAAYLLWRLLGGKALRKWRSRPTLPAVRREKAEGAGV